LGGDAAGGPIIDEVGVVADVVGVVGAIDGTLNGNILVAETDGEFIPELDDPEDDFSNNVTYAKVNDVIPINP